MALSSLIASMNGCMALQLPGRVVISLSPAQPFTRSASVPIGLTNSRRYRQRCHHRVLLIAVHNGFSMMVFRSVFYSQQMFTSFFSTVLFIGRHVLKATLTWCQVLVTPAARVADLCVTVDETHCTHMCGALAHSHFLVDVSI
jgi:hypothetical protein